MLGYKHTEETKQKMREAKLKNPTRYWLGKTKSAEIRTRISEGHKGLPSGNFKGDKAGYSALHMWMTAHFGQPKLCEDCDTKTAKSYHWANISGLYLRDRKDWKRLCQSCHFKMDRVGYRSWEKRKVVLSL